jgi:hypothetical protein
MEPSSRASWSARSKPDSRKVIWMGDVGSPKSARVAPLSLPSALVIATKSEVFPVAFSLTKKRDLPFSCSEKDFKLRKFVITLPLRSIALPYIGAFRSASTAHASLPHPAARPNQQMIGQTNNAKARAGRPMQCTCTEALVRH